MDEMAMRILSNSIDHWAENGTLEKLPSFPLTLPDALYRDLAAMLYATRRYAEHDSEGTGDIAHDGLEIGAALVAERKRRNEEEG